MANQIGAFFEAMPDATEARDGIALHIRKFWEPRMRSQLFAHIDAAADSGLTPIVAEAIAAHRAELEPVARETPGERAVG
jgi:formate dehydrogenase subunit delta